MWLLPPGRRNAVDVGDPERDGDSPRERKTPPAPTFQDQEGEGGRFSFPFYVMMRKVKTTPDHCCHLHLPKSLKELFSSFCPPNCVAWDIRLLVKVESPEVWFSGGKFARQRRRLSQAQCLQPGRNINTHRGRNALKYFYVSLLSVICGFVWPPLFTALKVVSTKMPSHDCPECAECFVIFSEISK